MRLGWGEILVILALLLLIFGAKRLPELGRSLGQSIREFQRAVTGKDQDKQQDEDKRNSER